MNQLSHREFENQSCTQLTNAIFMSAVDSAYAFKSLQLTAVMDMCVSKLSTKVSKQQGCKTKEVLNNVYKDKLLYHLNKRTLQLTGKFCMFSDISMDLAFECRYVKGCIKGQFQHNSKMSVTVELKKPHQKQIAMIQMRNLSLETFPDA